VPINQRFIFTDKAIERLRPPPSLRAKGTSKIVPGPISQQLLCTDAACRGLSLVVGSGGSRTYRSQFKLHDKWQTRKLERHGSMVEGPDGVERVGVDWARRQVHLDKLDAAQGRDPRERHKREDAASKTFRDAVDEYLAHVEYEQRAFQTTKKILTGYCAPIAWRQLSAIGKADVQAILDHHRVKLGHSRTARAILVALKTFWKWCNRMDYVDNNVPDKCVAPHRYKVRNQTYGAEELRSIWQAAEQLTDVECAYVKLLVLTVARRKALAWMERAHLNADCTLWTVPFDLVKAKGVNGTRTYRVPLPPLTRSLLLERLAASDNEYVFGTAPGVPYWPGAKLKRRLVKAGAPASFMGHSLRHTAATWFENHGFGLWERGLVLNHSQSGVTAGYSHGFAGNLKLELLAKWEAYVAEAVGVPVPGAVAEAA